jgi:opacity protein-like surface antigen
MKKFIILLFFLGLTIPTLTVFSQDGKYLNDRILIEGVYKRNLGNFSEVWSNAAGGYISYGIAFPEHNLLIIRTGVYSNSLKEGVNYQDASSTVIPLHIGGRYYFIDDRIMPFVSFMNGINLVFENTNLEGEKKNRTLVKYAWQVGMGISINVVSSLVFDVSVNYNSHFYRTEAMMTAFEYVVGLGWNFISN